MVAPDPFRLDKVGGTDRGFKCGNDGPCPGPSLGRGLRDGGGFHCDDLGRRAARPLGAERESPSNPNRHRDTATAITRWSDGERMGVESSEPLQRGAGETFTSINSAGPGQGSVGFVRNS